MTCLILAESRLFAVGSTDTPRLTAVVFSQAKDHLLDVDHINVENMDILEVRKRLLGASGASQARLAERRLCPARARSRHALRRARRRPTRASRHTRLMAAVLFDGSRERAG